MVSTLTSETEERLTSLRWRRSALRGRLEAGMRHPACQLGHTTTHQAYLDVESGSIWFVKVFARSCNLR
jgi:hypothetical protein